MKNKLKDIKILSMLDTDSRMPYSKIGKNIKLSQQLISHKVKNYLSDDIISGFYPLIDYVRFGYLNFRVFFKVNYLSKEKFLELIKNLSKSNNVIEIAECGGRSDLLVVFANTNPSQFNKQFKSLIAQNPKQLKNYDILTTVVTHYYPRTYLTSIINDEDLVIGGDRPIININSLDKDILFFLNEDAKTSAISIAKDLEVDPKTIILRMNNLKKAGIIKGFKPLLNVQKIDFFVNKIIIKYHNLSVDREQELQTFCKLNPNIIEFNKLIGSWDLELTVETKTKEEFRNIYISIRERFEDIIEDTESLQIFKIYKKRLLPEEFFLKEI
ncbi:MAG: winged helix-turn-helix transcriptional regulator [Nanoarchaeota archaeon]